MNGCDFSDARPSIATLQQNKVVAVGRYVGSPGNPKNITAAELQSYVNAGIGVWLVFENTANDATGGFSAGVANAKLALANIPHPSFGITRPIYFAVDSEVNPASTLAYFQGICSVIHPTLVGVYGEGALCTYLQQQGLAFWFWQSESTAFPGNQSTLSITHIQQTTASFISGTDFDDLCKVDVGQYPSPQKESEVALVTLPANQANPYDVPSADNVAEVYYLSFDASVAAGGNMHPTTNVRIYGHESNGSDAFVELLVYQGTVESPSQLSYNPDGTVTVTKGWPIWVAKIVGIDNVSFQNKGSYDVTLRV